MLPRSREQHFRERFCAYFMHMMVIAVVLLVVLFSVLVLSNHPFGTAYVIKNSVAITAFCLVLLGTSLWLRTIRSFFALILLTLLVLPTAAACLAIITSEVVIGNDVDLTALQRMFSQWWCLSMMFAAGAIFCITARARWMNVEFGAR